MQTLNFMPEQNEEEENRRDLFSTENLKMQYINIDLLFQFNREKERARARKVKWNGKFVQIKNSLPQKYLIFHTEDNFFSMEFA